MRRRETGDRDAYGHEIWDFYNKLPAYEIIERDDGFIDTSTGPVAYFSEFENWLRIEKAAIKFAKGRVLDVGCGAGRVAIYLQNEKELDILGIDNSPLAIKVSKLRGLKKAKLLDFHKINFPPTSFDTVVMFGNNFGLFANPALAKKLLKKLHRMTSDDATIICQSVDPYKTDNPDHLAYQRRNKKIGKLGGEIRIRARYRMFIGSWFEYLFVSKEEMKEIVMGTDWKIGRFFDDAERPFYIAMISK